MKRVVFSITVFLSVLCFSTPAQTVWTNAVSLDGVDDYIQAPAGIWFSSEFTVEVWVRAYNYGYSPRIIDFGNGAPLDNVILTPSIGIGGYPALYVYRGESQEHLTSPIPIPLNQWVHLAATLKNGTATLYMDGAAVASGPVHAPVPVLRLDNYIGRSAWSTDSYLAADLDDLRIWNVARSATEIAQDRQHPLSGEESNLVAYWKFDESSGTTIIDASRNGLDGDLINGTSRTSSGVPPQVTALRATGLSATGLRLQGTVIPNGLPTVAWFEWGTTEAYGSSSDSYTFTTNLVGNSSIATECNNLLPATPYYCRFAVSNQMGVSYAIAEEALAPAAVVTRPGAAASFNSQSNQYATIDTIAGLTPGDTPHTIEAWVQFPIVPTGTAQRILTLGQENGGHRWTLNPDGSCTIGTGGAQVNTTLAPGVWTHVAAAYNGTQLRVCTNGVQAGITVASFDLQGIPLTMAQPGAGEDYFTGRIDELRLWNQARTEAALRADHRAVLTGNESGLLACWRFNEDSGDSAADATGNGNDASLDAAWGPGVDIHLVPRPSFQSLNESNGSILLSGNLIPGTAYRIATTTNLNEPWELISNEFSILATNTVTQHALPIDAANRFYRWEVEPTLYGIVDVMVTDESSPFPAEYSGLTNGVSTGPFIPGEVGIQRIGADVNEGTEYFSTRIGVKYQDFNRVPDARRRILTDIAVVPLNGLNAVCPDGHILNDANPICPDGWQRASGTSRGITGALTPITDGYCHHGLCVRYSPVDEVQSNNLAYYIEKVALSITPSNSVAYPPEAAVWERSMQDIQESTGDRFVYVCYAKRPTAPLRPPLDDQDKLEELIRYAPLVWLAADGGADRHYADPFQPSSVEWAFPYLERFLNTDGNYWLRTVETLEEPSSVIDAFYGDVESAPVYAFWVEKAADQMIVDLVYYFYYPYNRGKSVTFVIDSAIFGNHVGDWEHVTVRLQWGQPIAIYVSAHNFGGVYDWHTVTKTNSTHPVIYSAWGSHGCWLDAGNHHYATAGITKLRDYCNAGTAWNTWERVEGFDYYTQTGLGSSPWPVWMSTDFSDPGSGDPSIPGSGPIYRWGNPRRGEVSGYYRLENGPTGPASKGVWDPDVFK